MKDYLNFNKNAYDILAKEFGEKVKLRHDNSKFIADYFSFNLKKRFSRPKVLELGPGSGDISRILYDSGCDVDAIEFSEKMAEVYKKNSPETKLIVNNFLTYNFGDEKYSGILGIAFIHLFDSDDSKFVMNKVRNLLDKNGLFMLSTTLNDEVEEGYFVKSNFQGEIKRFRKKYTSSEMERLIHDSRFRVVDSHVRKDIEVERDWMSYLMEKI